ncbi:MAG: alkaline phosphatase PhoX [Pseudomonadota bacterium]
MRSWTRRRFLQTSATFFGAGLTHKVWSRGVTLDLVADPNQLIDLPDGFSYQVISENGAMMSDGYKVPGLADGMAAFSRQDGRIVLIRNHEIMPFEFHYQPFIDDAQKARLNPELVYDYGGGETPGLGGTTTLVFNPKTKTVEEEYLSLLGTEVNCAGGTTPWGTWVSCEETSNKAGVGTDEVKRFRLLRSTREKNHGYNFEVSPDSKGLSQPIPLQAMGRFDHEAIAVEPKTGTVYQTEDRNDGLFYRFLPKQPGNLTQGGKLQALTLKNWSSQDTRNWSAKQTFPLNQRFEAQWITMEDPNALETELRFQGKKKNATIFARAEGICVHDGRYYFTCTTGGKNKHGQIFCLTPGAINGDSADHLTLVVESQNPEDLRRPDNITSTPWGDIFVCEDAGDKSSLIGLTAEGQLYPFAHAPYKGSELAGACFDATGQLLFINIQQPGITLVITGPWDKLSKTG